MAGGTDLLGVMKDAILPDYPKQVVDIRKIPNSTEIELSNSEVRISALTRLTDICDSNIVKKAAPGLAEAAHSVATPQIRNVATIGGNICQDVRCWYYRYPHEGGGRLVCRRKGGDLCYAINGDNRYHSVFGGMRCGSGGCSHECPAGIDIPAYMEQIRNGNWDAAAKIILKYNPMPMMTSRVCPHLCTSGCNQNNYGESVNIPAVERSLGDYILAHKDEYYQVPKTSTGKKTAIIGAGPGGLSAAYYLRKAGNEVTVYDRMEKPGGVLQYGIPHYRLPKTIVDEFCVALADMGIHFVMSTEIGKDISIEEIRNQNDAVYVGTGAWKQPVLGISGEELTEFGLNFLVEVNTYLHSAIGQNVLVCGGGNVAMDVALTARRLGAKTVRLVCLESREEMPASAEEVANAEEEGIEIHNGWGLNRVVTGEDGKVTGLEAKKCISVFNEEHRFSPKYDENDKQIFSSDTIILATGQRVDISFLGERLGAQLRSKRGLINADIETGETPEKGYYAGGDAVTGPNIAIRAIRAGRTAAASMNRDLGVQPVPVIQEQRYTHFDPEGIQKVKSNKLPVRLITDRTLTDEDFSSFDVITVLAEAGRCMNCGCYSVSSSDIAPMLMAMNATIVTTEREVPANDFFTEGLTMKDKLARGEIVREIRIPVQNDYITHYYKFRLRDSVDFAIVGLGSSFKVEHGIIQKASLVFGGVAPMPYRVVEAEKYLEGKAIDEDVAEKAAEIAVKNATPLAKNKYKVREMQTMLKDAVMAAARV